MTRKFHVLIAQNNGKEMYKMFRLHLQIYCFCLPMRSIDFVAVLIAVAVQHSYTILLIVYKYQGCELRF